MLRQVQPEIDVPIREPGCIQLARLPTPLVELSRLNAELDGAQVWMKRDDLTGLELSGNKVRKLEYVAADAIETGCDAIVTEGTCQSNHCRATAAVCAKLGLKAVLLLRPEPPAQPQGNHLLDTLFGATWKGFSREHYSAFRERIIADTLAELRAAGHAPRWTPAGASEPLGCWGYLRMMEELATQTREAGMTRADVVLAVSSGGTYAGALLGKRVHHFDLLSLWAVPVSDDAAHHAEHVGRLCDEAIERYGLPAKTGTADMQFVEGYVGAGYAVPTEAGLHAMRLLARTEGILLDPVYTAKAFAAVLDGVRDGRWGRQRPVIFVHTGGIFSNFAWPDVLLGHGN